MNGKTRTGRSGERLRWMAWVMVVSGLGGGLSGCGKKSPPIQPGPAKADAAPWVTMEMIGPGQWEKIAGGTDLAWDAGTRELRIGAGLDLNGARWAGPLPTVPYTVELDARRLSGSDFFCGLTFPARSTKECLTLIVGGWGGSLVGISSIDDLDASENPTGSQHEFENKRWYHIRLEVGKERLQAWIDDRQVVDVETTDHKLSLRPGPVEACAPFGLATWDTSAEVRGVRWRNLGN